MTFDRIGQFAVRRRWWIVAAWAVLILVALPLAPRAPGALSAGGFILDDLESARAKQVLQQELGAEPSAFVLVYTSDTFTAGTPAWLAAVDAATKGVAAAPHVTRILSHVMVPSQVSADGHTAYDVVFLDLPPDSSPDAIPGVAAVLKDVPGLTVRIAGGPAFYGDVQTITETDLRRSELISLPLAAIALLLVFGGAVAAGVPLAVGGAAVLVALAGIFIVASLVPMSIFVLNLATLLGLGLGVDYSLLMTSRFREELARRDGPDRVAEAVRATVATAGRAVFFSGLTVLLGLLGLVLFEFMILRSVGIAGAIVVGLTVAAALTLLPAVLAIVGTRIDAFSIRKVTVEPGADGPWARLARRVMRHPVAVLVPTLALLLALGVPFLHVRFNAPDSTILPASVPSREAYDILADEVRGRGVRAAGRRRANAGRRHRSRQRRPAVRLLAPACRRPAGESRRELRRRRPAPHPRAIPVVVLGSGRSARPLRGRRACRDDEGQPGRLHGLHAVRTQQRRGAGAGARDAGCPRTARPAGRRLDPGGRRSGGRG